MTMQREEQEEGLLSSLFPSPVFPPPKEEVPPLTGRSPVTFTVSMPSANVEYRYQFPEKAKRFWLKARSSNDLRISYRREKVASSENPYFTLEGGSSYSEEGLYLEEQFIYFACAVAGETVEGVAWS